MLSGIITILAIAPDAGIHFGGACAQKSNFHVIPFWIAGK
jgi:hypothetical protein